MSDDAISPEARRTIRRGRIITGTLLGGSLAALLGGPAVTHGLGAAELFSRLRSPLVLGILGLFYLIYVPASLRIYYVLLLNAKGVFSAAERRRYEEGKLKWERYLLRAALLAVILLILLAAWSRFGR